MASTSHTVYLSSLRVTALHKHFNVSSTWASADLDCFSPAAMGSKQRATELPLKASFPVPGNGPESCLWQQIEPERQSGLEKVGYSLK